MNENATVTYTITIEVPIGTHYDALDMCEMSKEDIEEMLRNDGINGLRNHCANTGNWVES